nr:peptide chain release factor N(5)-glutamine methyltransferase [uncultured Desulfobulbus sp.]
MAPSPKSIAGLLQSAAAQLTEVALEDADLEARLLLQFVTTFDRTQLVLRSTEELAESVITRYQSLIDQRCQRIPLQHLTGLQEFWSLELIVSPAVLIPRPETEFLVEQVLEAMPRDHDQLVLDMCTGSGAIALVLARELGCRVVAVDLSLDALAIAQGNRGKYQLQAQVDLVQSDLFAGLHPASRFDCIVSNPPYIVEAEIDGLDPEVARFEPRMALSGGENGLDCIGRIIDAAPDFLQPGGWLFMEIGADQKAAVERLLRASRGPFEQIEVLADYAGRPRVARGRLGKRR